VVLSVGIAAARPLDLPEGEKTRDLFSKLVHKCKGRFPSDPVAAGF